MEHILEQLFLFSKLDINDFPLAMRSVDIIRTISNILEEIEEEYALRGLVIRFEGTPGNLFVSADTPCFRNVVINILENSVRYKTKEKGEIEISTSIVDNFVVLYFADDGPGVSIEDASKLFDAFYRTDPSRNKKGSGLGLAISAKIIERMGGEIHAERSASGGLAIVIHLPLLGGNTIKCQK
jgi:signal transduction histidine kinase